VAGARCPKVSGVTKGDVTPQQVAQAAHQAGIPLTQTIDGVTTKTLQNPDGVVTAGIALGGYEVRPLDMANAFGTIANDGQRNPVHFISKIQSSSGDSVWEARPINEKVFDPANAQNNTDIARTATKAMIPVVSYSGASLTGGRPAAAKTGTVQGDTVATNSQAWMVGYTPQVSTAIWVGPKDTPMAIKGNYSCRPGRGPNHDIFGADEPTCIWKEFMNEFLANMPKDQFQSPTKIIGTGGGDDYTPTSQSNVTTTVAPPTSTTGENPAPTTSSRPCIPNINCPPKPPKTTPPTETSEASPTKPPFPPTFAGGGGGGSP